MPGIAAGHLYMLDPGPKPVPVDGVNTFPWDIVPEDAWKPIRFKNIEMLFVSPFHVQPDGTFDLDDPKSRNPEERGTLENRFRHVLETARAANPSIKILAQQFWDRFDYQTLAEMKASNATVYDTYAASVKAVVKKWNLDGYDVDYEWRSKGRGLGNQVPDAPVIISKVRAQLNNLGTELKKKIYVTCSPASSTNLIKTDQAKEHPLNDIVDYVNVQTYDGGVGIDLNDFTTAGVPPSRLLYGIWPENTNKSRSPTIDVVLRQYTNGKLGGVHSWRVNSDNATFENQVQALIYDTLHGTSSGGYVANDVKTEWDSGKWTRKD